MPPMRDLGPNLRQLLASMVRQARELRLQQTASSLTLLTLLAVVPMAAVGLLVLTALPAFGAMRASVQRFVSDNLFLPSFSETVTGYIEQFVAAADKLSVIGTAFFFATAMSAMLTIDRTMNDIWRTPRPRPLGQRLVLYWALLTLGPVLLGGALGLQVRVATQLGETRALTGALAAGLPTVLGILGLTLLYRLVPNERVRWRHALLGAFLAALLLEGLKRLLGLYITRFPSYTVVYGAFAALPLLLLWLVALWMSVILGALLAANLRYWGVPLGPPHHASPAGEFDRMCRIVAAVLRGGAGVVPSARFRPDFDGDAREADRVAALLGRAGLLVRVWPVGGPGGPAGVWDEHWLPAPGMGALTLRPVFEQVWDERGARRERARRRAAEAEPPVDPGGAILDRPLREVFALPGAEAALRTPGLDRQDTRAVGAAGR